MIGKNATAKVAVVAAAWGLALALATAGCAETPSHAADPSSPTYCKPQYPKAALRAQVQGVTVVAFHVNAKGEVTGADIVRSSGPTHEHRLLDQETASALSRCHFVAATDENGHPIDSVVPVTYRWKLE